MGYRGCAVAGNSRQVKIVSPFDRIDPAFLLFYKRTVDETLTSYASRPESTARRAKGLRGSALAPKLDLDKLDDVAVCAVRALRRDTMFGEFSDEELLQMISERRGKHA